MWQGKSCKHAATTDEPWVRSKVDRKDKQWTKGQRWTERIKNAKVNQYRRHVVIMCLEGVFERVCRVLKKYKVAMETARP